MSDQIVEPESSLADRLEQTSLVEVNRPPTIDELKSLAEKGQKSLLEYGAQVLSLDDGSTKTALNKSGSKGSIFEPDVPNKFHKRVRDAVFIHSHPILETEQVGDEMTLHIFPSENGDFFANMMSRTAAGYLNTSSIHGLTMNIGVDQVSREEDLTRRLKIKAGAKETGKETKIWKILSGEKAGSVIVDQQSEMVDAKFSMGNDEEILASFTEYGYAGFEKTKDREIMPSIGTVRYFLFVSWDRLKEVESKFGGLENLFFGDGVNKLVEELNVNVPHEQNLSQPCKIFWKPTKNRGE